MAGYVYGLGSSARVHRATRRPWWPRLVGRAAAGAGHAVRLARSVGLRVPGVAGAVLVSAGAWLAWPPAGLVVAGVWLLLIDRRVPPA